MEMIAQYRQYQPTAQLAGLVECYWTLRSSPPLTSTSHHPTLPNQAPHPPTHTSPLPDQSSFPLADQSPSPFADQPLIPGGRVELIFNFGSPFHWLIAKETPSGLPVNTAHFMGQRDRLYFARPTGPADMMGIRFRSGAPTILLSAPISDLLNKMIPAEDLLGPAILEWEARLYEQPNDTARINLLDHLLLNRITQKTNPQQQGLQQALGSIRNNETPSPIAAFCQQSGWSYKQLERTFLKEVGYTPKSWQRLVRFNKALRQMHANPKESLTSICYDCGYYDQSHFIKDFSRYAGTTPGRFQVGEQSIAGLLIRHQPV